MPNETDSLLYKYFKLKYSTGLFILFSVLSCGIYTYFWFIKLLEKFPKEDVKSSIFLIFAVIAIPEWLDFFDLFFDFSARTYTRIIYWCYIAIPYISYNYRNEFRNFVEKEAISVNISTFYLIVFPIVYQYHILRNTYIVNESQPDKPLTAIISPSNVTNKPNLSEIPENNTTTLNNHIHSQYKKMDKNQLRNKLIKLKSLYRDGKITKEKYDRYIEYLKSQLKQY